MIHADIKSWELSLGTVSWSFNVIPTPWDNIR